MSAHNQPPPGAVANLPIGETLRIAFLAAYTRPGLLFRAAAGGLLILAVTAVLALVLPPHPLTLVLLFVAPLAAYSHFGVNWYRVMLLGPEGMVRPLLRWDRRHWRFLGYNLAISGAMLALDFAMALMLPFAGPLISIVVVYLAARVSFIFPTVAVDEPYSLAYSWRHTAVPALRLTATLLVAGIPLFLGVALISSVTFFALTGLSLMDFVVPGAGPAPSGGDPAAGTGIQVGPLAILTFKMVSEMLCMAALAMPFGIVAQAFRTCTGWVPANDQQIAERFD